MGFLKLVLDLFLHLDVHLQSVIATYGALTYAFLFAIIFCETGLVVTPFLPGDSLLFAAGAMAAKGAMNPWLLFLILGIAAITGNMTNYAIGRFIGPRVFTDKLRLLKREHLEKTHQFFEKYGSKTIILSRFLPIFRTVAPFVAGIGKMDMRTFSLFNLIGGASWVALFVFGGYFFGTIPAVEQHFSVVILAIIVISLLPTVIGYWRHRRRR